MDLREVLDKITGEAERGELTFPTHGEMALRVRHAIEDPNCSVDQLARLVLAEPLLAARVVAVANSVAYNRSGRSVTDVRKAVSLIGFNALRALATAVVVRQMESMCRLPVHRAMASRLWEHTTHVAALSHVIARRVTRQDPETAFFAGIVHEVGGFYLIAQADQAPGVLDGPLPEREGEAEAKVGLAVLTLLAVPESVVTAIEALWDGYLAMPPASLGDTLLLADRLASVESPLGQLAGSGRQGMSVNIDMVLDDETLSGILRESEEELASLTAALSV